jgi:hypothetical protein
MYNQSKPITCLKCKPKIIYIYCCTYLFREPQLAQNRATLGLDFNSILKGNQLPDYAPMTIPTRFEASSPNNL